MDKCKILIIIVIAVIFGMGAGIVGEIVSRVYIMESAFGLPLYGEINVGGNGSNLVIREAKKVVVEQSEKLAETANSMKNSMVGIYKKIESAESKNANVGPDEYYRLDNAAGQGFIITSDGWIITTFLPEPLKAVSDKGVDAAELKKIASNNFVIITSDRKIYPVNQAVYDKESGYVFWHITATGLSVKRFAVKSELVNGQSVFAYNLKGWIWPTIILGSIDKAKELVRSSDICQSDLLLASTPSSNMAGALLFDYNGGLVGILNNTNKTSPIYDYQAVIESLLKAKDFTRPSLGVNYIDLSLLAGAVPDYSRGALISKDNAGVAIGRGSVAEKAGLKEGDIIISINGIDLNADNRLCDLIQQNKGGDKITLVYLRNKEKREINLILGSK